MDQDFSSIVSTFKGYFGRYDKFVRLNPRLAAEVEAIIRWSSYLIASRKSPVLGELLSSGANILQLCNDIILRQGNEQLKLELANIATQLKTFLSVIQSLELLAEIYARDNYGTTGKWAIISVIQITKAAIKLILLLVFDQGLSRTHSIAPLDRIQYSEIIKLQEKFGYDDRVVEIDEEQPIPSTSKAKSVMLKSTGRRMRSITESPPRESRFTDSKNVTDVADPANKLQRLRLKVLLDRYRQQKSAVLTEKQIYGEVLHITRPLAHLALMGAFGTKSWLSYFTSMAMDISSLYLVRSPLPLDYPADYQLVAGQPGIPQMYQFNMSEKLELGQRASSLLLYLLRSPFFDEYTKQRALEGLATTAENVPLLGGFLSTFIHYIPEWQKDYFRTWSE